MKRLIDNTEVSDRSYYFLMDWNKTDAFEFMTENFSETNLLNLSSQMYLILWLHATASEDDILFDKI